MKVSIKYNNLAELATFIEMSQCHYSPETGDHKLALVSFTLEDLQHRLKMLALKARINAKTKGRFQITRAELVALKLTNWAHYSGLAQGLYSREIAPKLHILT